MLREIVNRKVEQQFPEQEWDNYFPEPLRKTSIDVSILNFCLISQTSIYRDTSTAHKGITLRNFASNFQNNQKILIDFQGLERFMDDKVNFVSVMGCQLYNNKASLIQISDQPFIIINGISYFLLTSQSCNLDVLKYIYTLCQSIYVSQKLLPDLEYGFNKIIDASETWDINNNLYIVSKHFNQNDSQLKTTASTRKFYEYYDRCPDIKKQEEKKVFDIRVFQKYFTQIYVVNQTLISFSDSTLIKEHLEQKYDAEVSRWYTYQSLLKSCTKFYSAGPKIFSLKQFHRTNNQQILQTLEQKVLSNYNLFALEVLKKSNSKVHKEQNLNKQNSKDRNSFQQKEAEWQNQKQRIKKIKKIILQPFIQVQNTWLGRNQHFIEHCFKIKEKIDEELNKIVLNSLNKSERGVFLQIEQMIEDQNQNNFQIIGHQKFDNAHLNFSHYVTKIKSSLSNMLKSNAFNKKWKSKNEPVRNNRDFLSNLETRIDINQRKKQGLEQAIKLAMKQHQYLNDLVFNIKRTREDKR